MGPIKKLERARSLLMSTGLFEPDGLVMVLIDNAIAKAGGAEG